MGKLPFEERRDQSDTTNFLNHISEEITSDRLKHQLHSRMLPQPCIDLICGLLQIQPSARLSAIDALTQLESWKLPALSLPFPIAPSSTTHPHPSSSSGPITTSTSCSSLSSSPSSATSPLPASPSPLSFSAPSPSTASPIPSSSSDALALADALCVSPPAHFEIRLPSTELPCEPSDEPTVVEHTVGVVNEIFPPGKGARIITKYNEEYASKTQFITATLGSKRVPLVKGMLVDFQLPVDGSREVRCIYRFELRPSWYDAFMIPFRFEMCPQLLGPDAYCPQDDLYKGCPYAHRSTELRLPRHLKFPAANRSSLLSSSLDVTRCSFLIHYEKTPVPAATVQRPFDPEHSYYGTLDLDAALPPLSPAHGATPSSLSSATAAAHLAANYPASPQRQLLLQQPLLILYPAPSAVEDPELSWVYDCDGVCRLFESKHLLVGERLSGSCSNVTVNDQVQGRFMVSFRLLHVHAPPSLSFTPCRSSLRLNLSYDHQGPKSVLCLTAVAPDGGFSLTSSQDASEHINFLRFLAMLDQWQDNHLRGRVLHRFALHTTKPRSAASDSPFLSDAPRFELDLPKLFRPFAYFNEWYTPQPQVPSIEALLYKQFKHHCRLKPAQRQELWRTEVTRNVRHLLEDIIQLHSTRATHGMLTEFTVGVVPRADHLFSFSVVASGLHSLDDASSFRPLDDYLSLAKVLCRFFWGATLGVTGNGTLPSILSRPNLKRFPHLNHLLACFALQDTSIDFSELFKPGATPSTQQPSILSHVFFWDKFKRAEFMLTIYNTLHENRHGSEYYRLATDGLRQAVAGHITPTSPLLIFSLFNPIRHQRLICDTGTHCEDPTKQYWYSFPEEIPTHDQMRLTEHTTPIRVWTLICLLRHSTQHIEGFPNWIKARIGQTPSDIYHFLARLFPNICFQIFHIIRRDFPRLMTEPSLTRFFWPKGHSLPLATELDSRTIRRSDISSLRAINNQVLLLSWKFTNLKELLQLPGNHVDRWRCEELLTCLALEIRHPVLYTSFAIPPDGHNHPFFELFRLHPNFNLIRGAFRDRVGKFEPIEQFVVPSGSIWAKAPFLIEKTSPATGLIALLSKRIQYLIGLPLSVQPPAEIKHVTPAERERNDQRLARAQEKGRSEKMTSAYSLIADTLIAAHDYQQALPHLLKIYQLIPRFKNLAERIKLCATHLGLDPTFPPPQIIQPSSFADLSLPPINGSSSSPSLSSSPSSSPEPASKSLSQSANIPITQSPSKSASVSPSRSLTQSSSVPGSHQLSQSPTSSSSSVGHPLSPRPTSKITAQLARPRSISDSSSKTSPRQPKKPGPPPMGRRIPAELNEIDKFKFTWPVLPPPELTIEQTLSCNDILGIPRGDPKLSSLCLLDTNVFTQLLISLQLLPQNFSPSPQESMDSLLKAVENYIHLHFNEPESLA